MRTCLPAAMLLLALSASASETALVCSSGLAPQVFSPGVISGPEHDAAPAFTPDGQTLWFSRSNGTHSTILESHLEDGRWSTPRTAPFSGHWSDLEPSMSPDGRFLVFVSNRPADGKGPPLDGHYMGKFFPGRGGNLWRIDRTAGGWSAPIRLPDIINSDTSTFAPSIAADGSLWFMHPVDDGRRFRLYRSQQREGRFESPQPLPFSDGSHTDVDPAVAPDESFVIFGSSRPPARDMDLFISFRVGSTWSAPQHLGGTINSSGSDAEARLSPDVRTLYYSSQRRSSEAAYREAEWSNGNYNIWSVQITSCLGPNPGGPQMNGSSGSI